MKAWEWIKAHPWTVAGGVGAVIVLYLLFRSGGSGTAVTTTGADPAVVQANTALQIAQLQTGAQLQALSYQSTTDQARIAGAIAVEQIHANVDLYSAQTQGTLGLAATEAQRQLGLASVTAQQIISLGAQQTEQRQIAAIEAINLASQDTIQQLAYYNAQVQQSGIASQVDIAQINANERMYTIGQQASAQKTQGRQNLLGGILGTVAAFI